MLVVLAHKSKLKISDLERYIIDFHFVFPPDIVFIVEIKTRLKKQYPKEIKYIVHLIGLLLDARDKGHTGNISTEMIEKKNV